jgi:hypothetical protein
MNCIFLCSIDYRFPLLRVYVNLFLLVQAVLCFETLAVNVGSKPRIHEPKPQSHEQQVATRGPGEAIVG